MSTEETVQTGSDQSQERIRQTSIRLWRSMTFHEKQAATLNERLTALRQRCQHPRLTKSREMKDGRHFCPDCGWIAPAEEAHTLTVPATETSETKSE